MQHQIFVVVLALLLALIMRWGFKHLPDEKWQILASVPLRKNETDSWTGVNLTYYGLLSACGNSRGRAWLTPAGPGSVKKLKSPGLNREDKHGQSVAESFDSSVRRTGRT